MTMLKKQISIGSKKSLYSIDNSAAFWIGLSHLQDKYNETLSDSGTQYIIARLYNYSLYACIIVSRVQSIPHYLNPLSNLDRSLFMNIIPGQYKAQYVKCSIFFLLLSVLF